VEVRSTDGESVSLAVVSYQFPGETSEYWDSNWLIIAGAIGAGHRRWKFRDACLTAFEAPGISAWLRSAAANGIEPSRLDPELGWSPSLVFIEPTLAFSVAPVDDWSFEFTSHLRVLRRNSLSSSVRTSGSSSSTYLFRQRRFCPPPTNGTTSWVPFQFAAPVRWRRRLPPQTGLVTPGPRYCDERS
jgi:hypothetical protein